MFGRKRDPGAVRVEIYRSRNGWRWRARSVENQEILAVASEAYADVRDCQQAVRTLWPDGVEIEHR